MMWTGLCRSAMRSNPSRLLYHIPVQVGNRGVQDRLAVPELAQSGIAVRAEETPDRAGGVVMIDRQGPDLTAAHLGFGLPADGAFVVLLDGHSDVVV